MTMRIFYVALALLISAACSTDAFAIASPSGVDCLLEVVGIDSITPAEVGESYSPRKPVLGWLERVLAWLGFG